VTINDDGNDSLTTGRYDWLTTQHERDVWCVSRKHVATEAEMRRAFKMRTALFWAIVQRIVVIPYRRFGTTYLPHA